MFLSDEIDNPSYFVVVIGVRITFLLFYIVEITNLNPLGLSKNLPRNCHWDFYNKTIPKVMTLLIVSVFFVGVWEQFFQIMI